jgi:hypothetical protein
MSGLQFPSCKQTMRDVIVSVQVDRSLGGIDSFN